MGGILELILGLVLVFALLLVFFELFFSLHCGHRQPRQSLPTTVASPPAICQNATGTSAFYSHGVLQPPPSGYLFAEDTNGEVRGKNGLHFFGLLSPATSVIKEEGAVTSVGPRSVNFMCISNPMYSGGVHLHSTPPFVTPDTSPSQMEEETEEDNSPPLTHMKKLPDFGLFHI